MGSGAKEGVGKFEGEVKKFLKILTGWRKGRRLDALMGRHRTMALRDVQFDNRFDSLKKRITGSSPVPVTNSHNNGQKRR